MKNLLKAIGLLIVLAGLFSCQTASIIKRHYNKGYYVSKAHKPSQPGTINRITKEKNNALEPEVIERVAQSSGNPAEMEVQTPQVKKEKQKLLRHPEKIKNEFKDESSASHSLDPDRIMKHSFKMPKYLGEAAAQDAARDALSLLWILILVLLIVYVIGLIFDLFGLGPVFHILGLIVLILLVLWLLRII